MARLATWLVMAGLLGCGNKSEQSKPPAPQPAAPEAAVAAPAPAAAAPATPAVAGPSNAAAAPFLPAAIGERRGVVFAEQAGGVVEGIEDGTLVAVVGESGGEVGDMADATVTIEHGGKQVKVRADRVLRDGTLTALHRAPDGQHAVFAPVVACGDLCHSVLWMIRAADGKRVKLGEGGPDVHVAWHPEGGPAAVGSGALWIVTLADYQVKAMPDYKSPSYSPDGILYVRGPGGSAFTVGAGEPVRVWDATAEGGGAGDDESEEEEDELDPDDPKPVEFVDGKPKFDLEWFPH